MRMACITHIIIGPLIIATASACAVSPGRQTTTNASGRTRATGTGSSSQRASTTSKSPHPDTSDATEPSTQNGVVLGASFACPTGCYSFGRVLLGGSTQRQIKIAANSGQSASVVAISTSNEEFFLTVDNCTGQVLQPGDSCTISITFKPQVNGIRGATLSVTADPSSLSGGTSLVGFAGPPSIGPPVSLAPSQPRATVGDNPTPSVNAPTPSTGTPTPSTQSS
jgi:Abnormal spindle-like microcephaly-assoc'd, ASPM-SPD-2-Hydin